MNGGVNTSRCRDIAVYRNRSSLTLKTVSTDKTEERFIYAPSQSWSSFLMHRSRTPLSPLAWACKNTHPYDIIHHIMLSSGFWVVLFDTLLLHYNIILDYENFYFGCHCEKFALLINSTLAFTAIVVQ